MPIITPFDKHEVLHTSSILSNNFDEYIYEKDFVQRNPELLAKAEEISNLLGEFYQLVGKTEVTNY